MKLFLAAMLLIAGAQAASAQAYGPAAPGRAACDLTMSQAPGVGALKLGMTAEQVLALFPGSAADPEVRGDLSRPASQFGVGRFIIRSDKYQANEKFAGVSRITLSLLDGRVSTVSISYDGPEWPHVDKFVEKVVAGTNLPGADAWQVYDGLDNQLKVLKCDDIEIRVFAGGPGGTLNYVLMSDLVAARTLKERRAKAREKTGQEPKP